MGAQASPSSLVTVIHSTDIPTSSVGTLGPSCDSGRRATRAMVRDLSFGSPHRFAQESFLKRLM